MTRFIEYNYLIAILNTIEEESKRAYKDIVYKYGYDDSNTDAALILRNATINTCGIIRDCISKNKEES